MVAVFRRFSVIFNYFVWKIKDSVVSLFYQSNSLYIIKANDMKNTQITDAAKHFLSLYAEENFTTGTIHEWWGLTVDQYPDLTHDDIEDVEQEIYEIYRKA